MFKSSFTLLGTVLACQVTAAQFALADTTRIVSVNSAFRLGNDGSFGPALSANGRFIAFASSATNLVPNDTNAMVDIFVRDRGSGTTERVSVSSAGTQANGNSGSSPGISADGRFVVFATLATNLVPGDVNGVLDVYLHDRTTHLTDRISRGFGGNEPNGNSDLTTEQMSVSADGRYVAFTSQADNLVERDTNHNADAFVYDRFLHVTELVNVSSAEVQGDNEGSDPGLTADGRYVVFVSAATNLVAGDTNNFYDIFIRDRRLGTTSRVSLDSNGNQANGNSLFPTVSRDGRYVGFVSPATNLVPQDTNASSDVFVRDRTGANTRRASVSSAGTQANNFSLDAIVSEDGQYITFYSGASNLVSDDTNGALDVFLHGVQTGLTERLSVSTTGQQADGDSQSPSISAHGRNIVFDSSADNLVPRSARKRDVFIRIRD